MHADEDFLAAVAANPHDPLTRLVYADWLDERNDPRGELVRIEEEVRFEPAWSEVLWSQKPRRNELRAMCDPAWLTAMRYGTDCLPLFYGRPFPDHWRDGWRLIREATERWLGVPMPDVGGHADEVAAVEKRLGFTLSPSVREFVAFAHDLSAHQQGKMGVFRDGYSMEDVPDQEAVSLIEQAEGTAHWAIRREDLAVENPPVHIYVDSYGEADERFVSGPWVPSPSLTEFMFNYALSNARFAGGSLEVEIHDVEVGMAKLAAQFGSAITVRCSFPFSNGPERTLYEGVNITIVLRDDRVGFNVARDVTPSQIPKVVWDFVGARTSSGVFAKQR